MLPQYIQVVFWSIPTFRLAVGIAIVFSFAVGLYRQPVRRPMADAYLGALVIGLIGARAFHVALNWDYFTDNRAEIGVIAAGGLDWHGALLGGLLGAAVVLWLERTVVRRRITVSFLSLLGPLSLALPLIGLGGWIGCLAAGCGYGKEVDTLANYPGWAASELVDVFGIVAPRYNTPYFGIILSVAALCAALLLRRWRREPNGSFWGLLAFMSAGMFIIGLYRADHTYLIDGLRADQVLDVIIGIWGLILALRMPYQLRSHTG